ncbi:MAG: hypothetical protein IPP73_16285 [Chitinophagaceae bacterium]|nr:hypothetical protein [Chitinophagaceae bacterium]
MKKFLLAVLLLAGTVYAKAQTPITWSFTAKKTADKTYEIHMTATLTGHWHLYSQTQPEDAIAVPTSFEITTNPLLTLTGKIKEVGTMEKFKDEKLGISANQYSGKVDFVQVVKLKTNIKTNYAGVVEYQICNDEKCLPPKKVTFSVALQ